MKATRQSVYQKVFSLSRIELLVLKGIISGDGDIGGRMASSHPDAKPPVSAAKKKFLEKLATNYNDAGIPLRIIDRLLKLNPY